MWMIWEQKSQNDVIDNESAANLNRNLQIPSQHHSTYGYVIQWICKNREIEK